jgi:hypothetical protein
VITTSFVTDGTQPRSAGAVPALIAVALVLVALAGCGDDAAPERLSGPLSYTRGGGLAGRVDQLVVKPDGTATLTTRRGETSFRLSQRQLDKLEQDLGGFQHAPEESRSDPPVPDALGHTVEYGGRTVSADDVAMPDELRPLMSGLGALVDGRYSRP